MQLSGDEVDGGLGGTVCCSRERNMFHETERGQIRRHGENFRRRRFLQERLGSLEECKRRHGVDIKVKSQLGCWSDGCRTVVISQTGICDDHVKSGYAVGRGELMNGLGSIVVDCAINFDNDKLAFCSCRKSLKFIDCVKRWCRSLQQSQYCSVLELWPWLEHGQCRGSTRACDQCNGFFASCCHMVYEDSYFVVINCGALTRSGGKRQVSSVLRDRPLRQIVERKQMAQGRRFSSMSIAWPLMCMCLFGCRDHDKRIGDGKASH